MPTTSTERFEGPEPRRDEFPASLGRYRISKELGRGGFGRVYLAEDELLKRPVAVKVLHLRASSPALVPSLLAEARIIAQLNHPGILPIFDAMETDDAAFCIVSPYVEGRTLRQHLHEAPCSHQDSAVLIARACDALHHAHTRGVVHRDVKPANIMITPEGMPILLDFGLAKTLQEVVKDGTVSGTPGYMSPEQARAEDHLVNGRSDIYSLGTILYEMLTCRRALPATSFDDQLRRITAGEPVSPRDAVPTVPKELSRICMKALHPQMRWRYPLASDMAEDLRAWLDSQNTTVIESAGPPAAKAASKASPRVPLPVSALSAVIRVVPRGLRAFDDGDADFFLKLVPGPRDQHGLPESLRFWKQRIESSDARLAFRVGVIYGPSGCGKSSLVGAGLLPRCAAHVKVVFHEARHAGNAARLARALQAAYPALGTTEMHPPNLIHQLRTGGILPAADKLLLVIDQTEQWLRAWETNDSEDGAALLNTLRQCDGGRVQALLLVRDDFWRGVSRLLAEADVEILSSNSALVDLFEPRHAELVLESFGRAYQCLPEETSVPLAAESRAFLQRAVEHLSEGGKISPVRLALFTEIFRARPWTLAALREVGGASGVAAVFLDDVFRGPSASGPRRVHEAAARRVFEKLVPATGDVRGPACRQTVLLEASGYADRPEAFQELLNLLDTELRLLTPVDPDDAEGEPAWQLTHDYMVPALRQWLLAEKATSRRGRAEIALAERAGEWQRRPARTRLPGLWEWIRLRALTHPRRWSPAERDWMQAGMRRARSVALCCGLGALVLVWALAEWRNSVHARGFARQILMAPPDEVAEILQDGGPVNSRTQTILKEALAQPVTTASGLNARLALVTSEPGHVETLANAMLDADARTFAAIRRALTSVPQLPLGPFRELLHDPTAPSGRRLHAFAALTAFQPDDPLLSQVSVDAAHWLMTSVSDIPFWAGQLQPLAAALSPTLEKIVKVEGTDAPSAALALAHLHAGNAAELVRLLGFFPAADVSLLISALRRHHDAGQLLADAIRAEKPATTSATMLTDDEEAAYAAQSNRLLASLGLGLEDGFWPELSRDADRVLRSYLEIDAAIAGIPAEIFALHLPEEKNAGRRQAALAALSMYPISALPAARRDPLLSWMRQAYASEADGGVHASIVTLMKRWSLDRELAAWQAAPVFGPTPEPHHGWWTTPGGVDMRVVAGPDGSQVALASCEVTLAEYRRFRGEPQNFGNDSAPELSAPVTGLSWLDAVRYCNWLTTQEGLGAGALCYVETNGQWDAYPDALSRHGYRLPTRAEWLAGATSVAGVRWDFGASLSHCTFYGWTAINAGDQPRRVGSLLPNEQGLWDTFGNASEWSHEWRLDGPNRLGEVFGPAFNTPRSGLNQTGHHAAVDSPSPGSGVRLARTVVPARP